jgi:ribosomal protein L37AE/L43A
MTTFRYSPTACENLNHRRANAPVPYCPECGAVVNGRIGARMCSPEQHALSRRQRSVFCVECGMQLIVSRG